MGSSGFLQRNLEKMELGRVFDGGFCGEFESEFWGMSPKKDHVNPH